MNHCRKGCVYYIRIYKYLNIEDMSEKNDDLIERKTLEELKKLKRESRRRNSILLIAALQFSSLIALYYLGRSSHQKD